MNATSAQLYMAVINLLTRYTVTIEDRHILEAIKIAKRTAELLGEDSEDKTPSDEDVIKFVKQAMATMNGRPTSRTQLVNTIRMRGQEQMIADYMVNRAESLGIIKSETIGLRTDYTLA